MSPPRVLTIAGSDSSGGAGIQQDLATLAALGCEGLCAVTSITAQGSEGLRAREDASREVVAAQIDVALRGGVAAVKTGMLGSRAIVDVVVSLLASTAASPLVVDPVVVASSGGRLLDGDAVDALRDSLIPLARVVTPNADEAALLTGIAVTDVDSQRAAAEALLKLGCGAAVVTGGHLDGVDAVDVVVDAQPRRDTLVTGPRIETIHTHGTGCMYSAALAAGLAKGLDVFTAAQVARAFVTEGLQNGYGGSVRAQPAR